MAEKISSAKEVDQSPLPTTLRDDTSHLQPVASAEEAICTTALPTESTRLDPARVSINPAWEIAKLGLAREEWGGRHIREKGSEAKAHLQNIRLLIKLNAELIALSETQASHQLNQKTLDLLGQLKEKGIEVWKGGNKVSKEELSQIKSQISSAMQQEQTEAQNIFAIDIQGELTNMNSVNNSMLTMISQDGRLKSTAVKNQIPR